MAYLEMKNITKIYPAREIVANLKVDFSVERNEIHAIVGENGAGKTTLMKVLYGLEQPDEGEIFFNGRKAEIKNPMDANRLGIGMVHQHFKLIPEFSIAENVVLGIEPLKNWFFFDGEKSCLKVKEVAENYGFHIDPRKRIIELTVGQMQLVEIVKMLYRQVELLILDEPTSVLTEQQVQKLFDTLRNLKKMGKTIVIITHKLNEVKAISDRVTVMRKGEVVTVRNTSEVDQRELSKLMVGKYLFFDYRKEELACGRVILEVKNVTLRQFGQERLLLDNVSFKVHSCEIVGVAGVAGNGLGELEDVLGGLRSVTDGKILHNGEDITNLDALELRKRGLAYVPANRLRRGSCLTSSVKENMIISHHHNFLNRGIFDNKKVQTFARGLKEHYSIDGDTSAPLWSLSGGNIQKVILARELASKSDFIIFSEPTWGLDVASSQFIYQKILEIRRQGRAVLLISSNLDEILSLADTIIVMYRGRIVARLPNRDISKELIGEYMLGLRDDFKEERIKESGD